MQMPARYVAVRPPTHRGTGDGRWNGMNSEYGKAGTSFMLCTVRIHRVMLMNSCITRRRPAGKRICRNNHDT